MWQKTTHAQQSALNRRPFLRNMLGLGAAVAAHPFVDGANSNPNCAEGEISAADSLFLYTKLLDRVSSAAYHLMVDEEAFDFQDCSNLNCWSNSLKNCASSASNCVEHQAQVVARAKKDLMLRARMSSR